ncbi:gamma-glutamylcyclotransferase family protein [Kiloniella majae]|uniref:gamma-glutamylcyclotransferase family protein n=1 Tax=Kiloniella majae TaxID=1938558 RepID=UPI000A278586|nr:gamma-glutamylcyclotransferase family protein [Kiloniella majae]
MKVFFYGLFMDKDLLLAKGLVPSFSQKAWVDNYALKIGERASLVNEAGARSYGVVMTLEQTQVTELYADDGVKEYQPENLTVVYQDGTEEDVICYNLPTHLIRGTNRAYAEKLLDVTTRLGFPDEFLAHVRSFV